MIYLAGPITGQTWGNAKDWREFAAARLRERGLKVLDPLRWKAYLADSLPIKAEYPESHLSSARGITTRDRWDAMRCDVLLANLFAATMISVGTVMEIAWADSRRIPIVLAMEPGNVHDHPMIREAAGFIAGNLASALSIVEALCCSEE